MCVLSSELPESRASVTTRTVDDPRPFEPILRRANLVRAQPTIRLRELVGEHERLGGREACISEAYELAQLASEPTRGVWAGFGKRQIDGDRPSKPGLEVQPLAPACGLQAAKVPLAP